MPNASEDFKIESFGSVDAYLDMILFEAERRAKEKLSKENKEP